MDWKKYKWFYTKSGKLVVGGKSAESNDSLLSELKLARKDYVVMHTESPGSPFCAIVAPISSVNAKDIDECAVFTGCFSKAWKVGLAKTSVHIFKLSNLSKNKMMKSGTWQVKGEISKKIVPLNLVLALQEGVIRAVPEKSVDKREIIAYISPGKVDKAEIVRDLKIKQIKELNKEQLLSALPAGGVKIKIK